MLLFGLIREVNGASIARPIPWSSAVKDAGSSANWIESATGEVNQEMVRVSRSTRRATFLSSKSSVNIHKKPPTGVITKSICPTPE